MSITQLNPIQGKSTIRYSTPAKIIPIKENKPCHKKARQATGNYALTIDEIKKILDYFQENEKWIHYLCVSISFNMAFRNIDILSLKWSDIFDIETGEFRRDIRFYERKNRHIADVRINNSVKQAVNLYIEKTGVDVSKNNFDESVFMQLSGTSKGSIITYDGCRKALKKAAKAVGINENVGLHSIRRAFGKAVKDIHPNDPNNMKILQEIFGHSSEWITMGYIGLTKENTAQYYEDVGTVFEKYVVGDEQMPGSINRTGTVCIDSSELRNILKLAYEAGMKNAGIEDTSAHMDELNKLISMIEESSV